MEILLALALIFGALCFYIARGSSGYRPGQTESDIPAQTDGKFLPFNLTDSKPVVASLALEGPGYVIDGDTLVVQQTQVRLFGIDAPELNHPYGRNAKSALINLCMGQTIRAEITAKDDHGRTVAKCSLRDGRDLSAEMVKLGMAIDWPKFSGGKYRAFEAVDARKKLWLADARQKGRMHVWEQYDAKQKARGIKD